MAEQSRNVLAGFFRRPKVASQAHSQLAVALSLSIGDTNEGEEDVNTHPFPQDRESSYTEFRSNPPVPALDDISLIVRHPESVYHKPSGDQMAEALKVLMMNQGAMDSVPVVYNACILHVLEAYQQLRDEVSVQAFSLEELTEQYNSALEELNVLKVEWDSKESDLRAHIHRLESPYSPSNSQDSHDARHSEKRRLTRLVVLLGRANGGMEKLTVVGQHTSVRGAGSLVAAARSRSTMKATFAAIESRRSDSSSSIIYPVSQEDGLSFLSSTPVVDAKVSIIGNSRKIWPLRVQESPLNTGTLANSLVSNFIGERGTSADFNSFPTGDGRSHLDQSSPEELVDISQQTSCDDLQCRKLETHATYPQSIPCRMESSTPLSNEGRIVGEHGNMCTGLSCPAYRCEAEGENQASEAKSKDLLGFSQLAFSFRPGDDADLLCQNAEGIALLEVQESEQTRSDRIDHSNRVIEASSAEDEASGFKGGLRSSTASQHNATKEAHQQVSGDVHGSRYILKEGPSYGIVPSVRHTSKGRINETQQHNRGGRQGSEQAVHAAVTAFKEAAKKR